MVANTDESNAFARKLIGLKVNPNIWFSNSFPLQIAVLRNDRELLLSLLAANANASLQMYDNGVPRPMIEILAARSAWDLVHDVVLAMKKMPPSFKPDADALGRVLWHAVRESEVIAAPDAAQAPQAAPALPAAPQPRSDIVIRPLIQAKANLDIRHAHPATPYCSTLHLAINKNNTDLMALAMYHGANVETFDAERRSPHQAACALGPTHASNYMRALQHAIDYKRAKAPYVVLSLHHHYYNKADKVDGHNDNASQVPFFTLPEELLFKIEWHAYGEWIEFFRLTAEPVISNNIAIFGRMTVRLNILMKQVTEEAEQREKEKIEFARQLAEREKREAEERAESGGR